MRSLEKGNIGPIVDAVLDEWDLDYTVLSPALPVNGRTVKDGELFVNGISLAESHMKDHQLTPIKDSNIPRLMERQSKYKAFVISAQEMKDIDEGLEKIPRPCDKRFCFVPDYFESSHVDLIAKTFYP